ncbi:unnamed protein product, partial [Discosporangium mesarthrocarpum]
RHTATLRVVTCSGILGQRSLVITAYEEVSPSAGRSVMAGGKENDAIGVAAPNCPQRTGVGPRSGLRRRMNDSANHPSAKSTSGAVTILTPPLHMENITSRNTVSSSPPLAAMKTRKTTQASTLLKSTTLPRSEVHLKENADAGPNRDSIALARSPRLASAGAGASGNDLKIPPSQVTFKASDVGYRASRKCLSDGALPHNPSTALPRSSRPSRRRVRAREEGSELSSSQGTSGINAASKTVGSRAHSSRKRVKETLREERRKRSRDGKGKVVPEVGATPSEDLEFLSDEAPGAQTKKGKARTVRRRHSVPPALKKKASASLATVTSSAFRFSEHEGSGGEDNCSDEDSSSSSSSSSSSLGVSLLNERESSKKGEIVMPGSPSPGTGRKGGGSGAIRRWGWLGAGASPTAAERFAEEEGAIGLPSPRWCELSSDLDDDDLDDFNDENSVSTIPESKDRDEGEGGRSRGKEKRAGGGSGGGGGLGTYRDGTNLGRGRSSLRTPSGKILSSRGKSGSGGTTGKEG